MKTKMFLLGLTAMPFITDGQVSVQKGGSVHLQDDAIMSVQGDFDAVENIQGPGVVLLNGNIKQSIGLHGSTMFSLCIQNANGVLLSSPLKIDGRLELQSGRLIIGPYNLELGSEAKAVGNETAYILTENHGRVIKSVEGHLDGFIFPVGTVAGYSPLTFRSSGKYNGAVLEITASSDIHPNKPASSRDYLNNYWTVSRRGIAGDVIATGFYRQVTGNADNIQPYFWNGHEWITKKTPIDTRNKSLSVDVPEGSGEIYAMRKGDELITPAASMTLLPNPVHSAATLVIRSARDDDAVVRIINNAGATVMAQRVVLRKGVNQVRINVVSLPKGQYIISSSQQVGKVINMIKQ